MSPVMIELKIICPMCQRIGTVEPDIIMGEGEPRSPQLIGLLVRDCLCTQLPRFKVNMEHGTWQLRS